MSLCSKLILYFNILTKLGSEAWDLPEALQRWQFSVSQEYWSLGMLYYTPRISVLQQENKRKWVTLGFHFLLFKPEILTFVRLLVCYCLMESQDDFSPLLSRRRKTLPLIVRSNVLWNETISQKRIRQVFCNSPSAFSLLGMNKL